MDAALPSLPASRLPPMVERASRAYGTAQGRPDGVKGASVKGDGSTVDPAINAKLRKSADEFETQFLSQMLTPMFEGIGTDPTFGGGHGEDMFRSLLVNEYGKQMSKRGGLGIGDAVYRELLRAQEASHG